MFASKKNYGLILLSGDIIIFYLGLFLTLAVRSLSLPQEETWQYLWTIHRIPFLYVHFLWILIFYIVGLYDLKTFSSRKIIYEKIVRAMIIAGFLAILLFYLAPTFKITPKTNLLLDIIFVTIFLGLWRRTFWFFSVKSSRIKILFLGASKETEEIINYLKNNPQMGYEPIVILTSESDEPLSLKGQDAGYATFGMDNNLIGLVKKYQIQIIVVLEEIMKKDSVAKKLYGALPLGATVMNFSDFYEMAMEKIPTSIISESWFLKNINEINKQTAEFFKRIFDIVFAILLGIPAMIILPFIAFFNKLVRGEVFYRQDRIGKNGRIFTLIKFGSMVLDAEKNGAEWAKENDERITKFGKFLRKTRLDELPQLWNVLKGEMSFIGPRPERPEFVKELEKILPYYSMRHLVRPGLSGWAQIRLPHGGVGEETTEKLQHDLYYIKNRSLILDASIALKTLAIIARREGR